MRADNIGLFDLDRSLADYDKAMLAGLAALKSPEEPDIDDVQAAHQTPHLRARMEVIARQPNWWFDLEPIAMGFQLVDLAKEIGFQIHVLTQGPRTKPLAWKEMVEWCQKQLGSDINIHITRNKGKANTRTSEPFVVGYTRPVSLVGCSRSCQRATHSRLPRTIPSRRMKQRGFTKAWTSRLGLHQASCRNRLTSKRGCMVLSSGPVASTYRHYAHRAPLAFKA